MKIIDNFRGTLYDYLGKKVSKSQIQAIYDNAEAEYSFKKLALYIAISYIANAITKCEFKHYVNNQEVKDEVYYTLNVSPNVNENSSQLWNKVINYLFDKGEALVVPVNGELFCADSYSVDEKPTKGNVFSGVTISTFKFNKRFQAKDVFYFKLDLQNVTKLFDDTYEKYGQMLAYAINSYARSNQKKYKLILKNIKAGDKQFQKDFEEVIKKQLENFIKNDNAVYPQFEGYNLEEFGTNIQTKDSSDVVALRKDIFDTVASALKIPVSMMYGNMNNVTEVVNQFLTFAVDPVTDMIEEELTRKTNTYETWKNGNYIEIDTTCISHIDILNVAEKVDKLIASGTCNIDEVRSKVGLNELDTEWSKTHWVTKNYDNIVNLLKQLKGGEESEQSK